MAKLFKRDGVAGIIKSVAFETEFVKVYISHNDEDTHNNVPDISFNIQIQKELQSGTCIINVNYACTFTLIGPNQIYIFRLF